MSPPANCQDQQPEPTPGQKPHQENDQPQRRILAVVRDLFFASKISAAAKRTGIAVEFVEDTEKLLQQTESAPTLVILDLNHSGLDPIQLLARLKTAPQRDTQIVGFFSHVQHDLKREATKAGCDLILPRSVFSQNLDELLRQRSCHL